MSTYRCRLPLEIAPFPMSDDAHPMWIQKFVELKIEANSPEECLPVVQQILQKFVTPQKVVDPNPKCPECGGDLGGNFIGRLEEHHPDCPLFPL